MIGAGDQDVAGLHRLAERVQHLRLELRQLVEEEHAVMRKRDLARPRLEAAADVNSQSYCDNVSVCSRESTAKRADFSHSK